MATTTSPATWIDLGGQTTCLKHAPTSLSARLQERPRAQKITTTITVWEKITAATITRWTAEIGDKAKALDLAACEACRHQNRTR